LQAQTEPIAQLGRAGLGIGLVDIGTVSLSPGQAIKGAVMTTAVYTKQILWTFGGLIKNLVALKPVGQDLSGPVGIAVMTGKVASEGIMPLLQFAAVLSINLAVINILPIPALDGGRVLFLLVEKIRRRAMSRTLEAAIHNIAFLLLISLTLLVTVRDVSRYGHAIVGGLKGLVGL
jgi:regulator of sigma E protease